MIGWVTLFVLALGIQAEKIILHVLPVFGLVKFESQTSEYRYYNILVPFMQDLLRVISQDKQLKFNLDISVGLLERWVKDTQTVTELEK